MIQIDQNEGERMRKKKNSEEKCKTKALIEKELRRVCGCDRVEKKKKMKDHGGKWGY